MEEGLFSDNYGMKHHSLTIGLQSKKQGKKLPLPLSEPQASGGYSQVEEIRSKWMPMSPL